MSQNTDQIYEAIFSTRRPYSESDIKDAFGLISIKITRIDFKKNGSGAYLRFESVDDLRTALNLSCESIGLEGELSYNSFFDKKKKKKGVLKKRQEKEKDLEIKNSFGVLLADDE